MLENLVNSKLKRRLLNILFNFPRRSFYVNELRLLSSSPAPAILAALRELFKVGVIDAAVKKRKRYFRINPYFQYYQELQDLVNDFSLFGGLPGAREDEVSKRLKKVPNLKLGILSGVFTMQTQLDVDLLLVGNEINRLKLQNILQDLEKLAGQEINYTIMDDEEFDERRVLNDRLIRDFLDHPHLVVFNK